MVETNMAIVIPSKNIYGDPQNPKVRDNVIERIEVGAVEVVPDNDYETPVYNVEFLNNLFSISESNVGDLGYAYGGVTGARYYAWALLSGNQSVSVIDLTIPKVKNNKYINKIYVGENKNGTPWIGVNVGYTLKKGTASANVTNIQYDTNYNMVSYSLGNIIENDPEEKPESLHGIIPKADTSFSYTANSAPIDNQVTATSNITLVQDTNVATIGYDDTDENFIKFTGIKIISKSKNTKLSYGQPAQLGQPNSITLNGEYEEYQATSIEITIYGNTIGIDLTDKTVYIPETNKTSKKVHSVDGNELMQTANYYSEDNGVTKQNAIDRAFTDTQTDYAKGKETATIRCDISDYYEYNATADNFKGDKVIAIDNSTGKMSFKMYEQVIPMVYGADGKDHPMSFYQDGSPKVFQVLGSNIFYDGAVWQELSLQEI